MAHLLCAPLHGPLQQRGSQPTNRKRSSSSLEDPVDRCLKYRKAGGNYRMPLDRLGFHPDNRGKAGVYPMHAHQVAHDGSSNGVSLRRYKAVEVVKVPEDMLAWITWALESN